MNSPSLKMGLDRLRLGALLRRRRRDSPVLSGAKGTRDGGFADPCRHLPNPCTPFLGFRLRVMDSSTAFSTKTLACRFGPGDGHNVMP
jgi:hypothetical protein